MKPRKQHKQKDILFILISSFVVVVAWIGFNIYHINVTSTVSPHVQDQLTSISPSFDQETIQQLKSREAINPLFEQTGSHSATLPAPSEAITPAPEETPVASQEAIIGK